MKYPIVIGVSGRKYSGKDEVFRALKDFWGERHVRRIAFADGVKEELAKACNVTVSDIEGDKEGFRLGLQWWGTEFRRRRYGSNYWTVQAWKKFEELKGQAKIVVFTDCRFPNEAELVKELGGVMWRILRAGDSTDTHASETALDTHRFDHVFLNNGTLGAFHEAVKKEFTEKFVLCEKS